ncbi:MAG: HpcH/HpaI aldolase/citrate lyase family protein [Granulosicoccus sp.]
MKLSTNSFTAALAARGKQVGLWVSLGSNFSAETIASSGYDWVLLDMEHSPNDLGSILGQLQVFKASSTTAIVRPSWNDPVLVKRLLDIGAPGLLFPMIQTVEEAELAVASTRYPPNGIRGVSGSTRANAFGRVTDYFDRIEQETAVLLQLETVSAIEKAVDIASVQGVSGIFFGPADIAADMGMLGQPMNPAVWDVIRPAAKKLIDAGVPVGTLVFDKDFAAELLNDGFSFVACGSDASLLAKGADALLSTVKAALS